MHQLQNVRLTEAGGLQLLSQEEAVQWRLAQEDEMKQEASKWRHQMQEQMASMMIGHSATGYTVPWQPPTLAELAVPDADMEFEIAESPVRCVSN